MAFLMKHNPCRDCARASTQTLMSNRNEEEGDYCDRHGKAALKARQLIEDRQYQSEGDPRT